MGYFQSMARLGIRGSMVVGLVVGLGVGIMGMGGGGGFLFGGWGVLGRLFHWLVGLDRLLFGNQTDTSIIHLIPISIQMHPQTIPIPVYPNPSPNPNQIKNPIEINLRIFVNQQQNQLNVPLLQNTPPPLHSVPITPFQYQVHPQPAYQRYPVYVSPPMVVGGSGWRDGDRKERIGQPVHASSPKPTRTQLQKTQQKPPQPQPQPQQTSPNKAQTPQIPPQLPIKCPICQQQVYRSTQKQHEQFHRTRIDPNKIPQIPHYQPKSSTTPIYSREDLLQILVDYEEKILEDMKEKVRKEMEKEKEKEKEPVILQERKDKEHQGLIIKQARDRANSQQKRFLLGRQERSIEKDIVMPVSHVRNRQPFPIRQITSPNISNIQIQDQSECFSQLDSLEPPFFQKIVSQSQSQLPIQSASKPQSKIIPQKISKTASQPQPQPQPAPGHNSSYNPNESSYYKELISEVRSGSSYSKRKKLPSNNMAYEVFNRT